MLRTETRSLDTADSASSPPTVALWTLARPLAANAIDRATADALERAVRDVEEAPIASRPRAVILAAESRSAIDPTARDVFCAGADLRELAQIDDPRPFSAAMTRLLARLAALPLPVVAAIGGDVYGGGCELLTACDLRVAEIHISLAFRQARMGLSTGWGGMTRLSRLIGLGAAKRLLLTGLPCEAEEALRIGLVDRVVDRGCALDAALELARACAQGAPEAVAILKRGADDAWGAPDDDGYAREIDRFVEAWSTGAVKRALAARRG